MATVSYDESEDIEPEDSREESEGGEAVGPGRWLEISSKEVPKEIDDEFRTREKQHDRLSALAKVHELWRSGRRNVSFVEDEDTSAVRVYAPRGTLAQQPVANKTDDLCARFVATITVDKPRAECEPATDSDEDRDAAEVSERVLEVEDGPSGINAHQILQTSLDRACTWASDLLYLEVDPHGGGWEPMELEVAPNATGEEDDPTIDPLTGQPALKLVKKFQLEDGQLSDTSDGAKKIWNPSIKAIQLRPIHAALLPSWSPHAHEADGVILCVPRTLGDLIARFPEAIDAMTDDELRAACDFRPPKAKRLIPSFFGDDALKQKLKEEERPPLDTLVFPYVTYYKSCHEYPEGAYIVTLGDKLIYRDTWKAELIQNAQGETKVEVLPLPISQLRQFPDPDTGNPWGIGIVAKLGPLDEIRATLMNSAIDYVFREANPNWFLPHGSIIKPHQLARRDGTPITYNSTGGVPVQEKIEPLPTSVGDVIDRISAEMDTRAGLEQAAQGVASPSVQSGKHAEKIVEQALVALSSPQSGTNDFYIRFKQIQLILIRAFVPNDQKLRYLGEDGRYKMEAWNRADLGGTRDVKLAKGSGTMMPTSAKTQIAMEQAAAGILNPDDVKRSVAGDVMSTIGMQDNVHVQNIRSEISDWGEGPPPEILKQEAQFQEVLQAQLPMMQAQHQQQAIAMQAMGEQVPPFEPPPGPMEKAALAIFTDLLCNSEQPVAVLRHAELQRVMATHRYSKQPEGWRKGYDKAYMKAKMDAGVMTLQEQAAQQNAANAQAAEQESAKSEGDKQSKAEEREHTAQLRDNSEIVKQQAKPAPVA